MRPKTHALLLFLLFVALPTQAALRRCDNRANPPNRYVPCEVFTTFAVPSGTNAYTAYTVWAEFSNPAAAKVTVYGYLDSVVASPPTVTYRFRFNPITDGAWTWLVFANVAGLVTNDPSVQWFNSGHATKESGFLRRDDASGFPKSIVYDCFADTPAGGPSECPPETNIPNGVDHPLLWGQTYYQIINNAATGSSSWQTAITSAKAKGFRKVRLLVYPWRGAFNGTYTVGGVTVPAKESTPYVPYSPSDPCNVNPQQINLAHFNTLDTIINFMYVQRMGAELILFKDQNLTSQPGNCGQTFFTSADDLRYAKYVVSRYAAFPNVTFSMSNEWQLSHPAYTTAQWNDLGEQLKPYDPFRIHPRSKNLRLMAIHPQPSKSPDAGLTIATKVDASGNQTGWMVHASQQWPKWVKPTSPSTAPRFPEVPPDQLGNDILGASFALGVPMIDDEFGYLNLFRDYYADDVERERHRNAIWGMAASTVYGTVGDSLGIAGHPESLVLRSEWQDRVEWDDFALMYQLFTDQNTLAPLGEVYKMRRRSDVFSDTTRAFVIGFTNLRFVVYDLKGSKGPNFTLTLPAPPAGQRYTIWRFDPMAGGFGYTFFASGIPGGPYPVQSKDELAHDTVLVIKPVPFP